MLCFVLGNLSSPDVVRVQKAMGSYVGDAYWRSKTPAGLSYEVKDILEETFDWEFLCLELE